MMTKKEKFIYYLLIIITLGLIIVYWKKYKNNDNNKLSISEKININIEDLIINLGNKNNIEYINATQNVLKIAIKDDKKIKIDQIKESKGISGVVFTKKMISLIVGNSAFSIKNQVEFILKK